MDTKNINVRVDKEFHDILLKVCRERAFRNNETTTISDLVRELIREKYSHLLVTKGESK